MTTYHMKQSIAGCLRNNRIGTIDFLEDANGKPLSDAEARIELNKLLEAGHTVMPVGDDCEGFDVFGGGCPGHEPLTGGDLCKAILKKQVYQPCFVSDVSESHAIERKQTAMIDKTYSGIKFTFRSGCNGWAYVVPINNMGEPLTAKEVGL